MRAQFQKRVKGIKKSASDLQPFHVLNDNPKRSAK